MSFLDKLKDLKNDAEAGAKDLLRKKPGTDAETEDEEEEKPFGTYIGGDARIYEPAAETPSPGEEPGGADAFPEETPEAEPETESADWDDGEPVNAAGGFSGKLRALAETVRSMPTGRLVLRLGIMAAAVVLLLVLLIASCSSGGRTPGEESESGAVIIESGSSEENSEAEPQPVEVVSRLEQIAAAFNANGDVVGWLNVPGLSDINSVVCQDKNSYSYNYRNALGKYVYNTYWIDGAYYSSKYNTFEGGAAGLSKNTVIFGHSDLGSTNLEYKADDAAGPRFSQLFYFTDEGFARKTPYIFFSTADQDMVWEVFAVFYNDKAIDGRAFWYIDPAPDDSAFDFLLTTAKSRSLYTYNVPVTKSDKILTFSTCTVGWGLATRENYRFVVMAKLVSDPKTAMKTEAEFVINPDAVHPPITPVVPKTEPVSGTESGSTASGSTANSAPATSKPATSGSAATSKPATSGSAATSKPAAGN